MRPINLIVIHCSATPNGKSLFRGKPGTREFRTPVQVIDEWHREPTKNFHRDPAACARFNPGLTGVGYHYVVYTNGALATGRHESEVGAHVHGRNSDSIGVCMVGLDSFSDAQWKSLALLVADLLKQYPRARVVGHRDLSPDINRDGVIQKWEWLKTCPGFNVADWLKGGMKPLSNNLLLGKAA